VDTLETSPVSTVVVASAGAASSNSAVSWGAIFAGAVVAAATSLLLFALGAGLDLAAMSPGHSAAYTAAAVATALIVTQWIASFLGGYITGRLRTRWTNTHTHEVFFRDTAHGLIMWCVATVFMASGLVAAASSALPMIRVPFNHPTAYQVTQAGAGAALPVTPTPASAAAAVPGTLVLPEAGSEGTPAAAMRWVTGTSAGNALPTPRLQLAAIDPDSGSNDSDRREHAAGSIVTALSMLIGAFIACVSAALGGRLRDLHP
jgi:hypothetical protein